MRAGTCDTRWKLCRTLSASDPRPTGSARYEEHGCAGRLKANGADRWPEECCRKGCDIAAISSIRRKDYIFISVKGECVPLRISIIGGGCVGLVSSVCFAQLVHLVVPD